jgi:DNA-binding NarL/FixJ family response regulator
MLATLSRTAVAEARAALGAAAYATASARGAKLDYHEAVAAALGDEAETVTTTRRTGQPDDRRAGNSAETARLTNREWDVTRLLGANAGLSNQQVAGQLCITVRTVEAHMSNIIRKLGVSSRAEVAVWAISNGPQVRR